VEIFADKILAAIPEVKTKSIGFLPMRDTGIRVRSWSSDAHRMVGELRKYCQTIFERKQGVDNTLSMSNPSPADRDSVR
jgi:hypothetical protein